ncbi:hypothetical protein AVEN_29495-1 [Araneus ventricosus]|uniref:Tc1-like transposase DDE domain-containing protein n=1 Tax=Araneus ventricosus TaxID=182803 RepID=A0A4Y2SLD9_ARAVE|nr:hypothetical protein AVEN_29495-1 [Araneus ventricosus]
MERYRQTRGRTKSDRSDQMAKLSPVFHRLWKEFLTTDSAFRRFSQPLRDAYGGGSVCVWSGISLGVHTDLHVFPRGTMNTQAYRDDILDAHVRPYARAIGDDFLLQDDNAKPHRARIVDDYLQQETIQHMEWPARSLDLNPIEHV